MKFSGLILATLFFAVGCSSDDNTAPLNDPGTATEGVSTEGTDAEGTVTEGTTTDGITPSTSAVLNRNNYIDIIAQALGIYASQPMRDSIYEPFEILENENADSSVFNQETSIISSLYTCSNGGTAAVEVLDAAATGFSKFVYVDCQVGDSIYDGEVEFNRSEGQSTKRSFVGYRVENGPDMSVLEIDGSVDQSNYVCRTDNYQSWSTTDFSWTLTTSTDERTSISQSNARFAAGTNCGEPWQAKMTGSFSVESPLLSGQTLAVSISTDMISDVLDSTNFQTGTMEINSRSDESKLLFNADNADSESVSISVVTPAGTETFNEPWTTWEGILIVKGTGK